MKISALVCLIIMSTSTAFAQFDEVVYETEWFLRNFRAGFTRPIPLNDEVYPITLDINETSPVFSTTVCATLSMDVAFENADFFNIVSDIEVTDAMCELETNQEFQDPYFDFFVSSPDEIFIFSVTPSPQNQDQLLLFIVKPNGNELIYSNIPILNTPQQELAQLVLFPNPARGEVVVKNTNQNALWFTIYNVTGALIRPKEQLLNNVISLSKHTSGIYFVILEDELGNSKVEKLVVQ